MMEVYMNLKIAKIMRKGPTEDHTLAWHFLEEVAAVEHAGEVRIYSKKEIAQYELETLTIKEKHNAKNY
jgi:SH3-like domain-containing protein